MVSPGIREGDRSGIVPSWALFAHSYCTPCPRVGILLLTLLSYWAIKPHSDPQPLLTQIISTYRIHCFPTKLRLGSYRYWRKDLAHARPFLWHKHFLYSIPTHAIEIAIRHNYCWCILVTKSLSCFCFSCLSKCCGGKKKKVR